MATNPQPASRTISWLNQVIEAENDWNQRYQRPVVYEFSNGRTFQWNPQTYTTKGP